ncbi:MAG TPA: ankyrin repeat domain-containing protein [Macromonas sp.]|nr:ankyrin repeat domain-containing protein [Macromonas sp.]
MPTNTWRPLALTACCALLATGASAVWAADLAPSTVRQYRPAVPPSFDCSETASPVQDFVCASDRLSALDSQTANLFRAKLRNADLFGRDQLLASHRAWKTTRPQRCAVPAERQTADRPDPTVSACLENDYTERLRALQQWQAATRVQPPDSDHPVSAYLQFTPAESLDAGLCERFRSAMNSTIKREGNSDVTRLPGVAAIASSRSRPETQQPLAVTILQRDAGPYGSYELRPTGLKLGGTQVLDSYSLGRWIGAQPNHGGRPSDLSSQTNDYAALDVFALDGRTFALVSESWGYYTPAASGESAYAGLYELASGSAQRQCLFKTYLKPPVRSAFAELPAYNALLDALAAIRDTEVSGLEPPDRRDEHLLRREQVWQLQQLPLVQLVQARQFGWTGWLHRRHDVTLERLFAWSEGSLDAKQLYRALLPTVKPAMAEVATTLQQTQGLTADEAQQASELLAMELFDHALGPVVDNSEAYAQPPAASQKYKPRYPVLAERADLEKGRPVANLYGAVLNRLPARSVSDFIAWEQSHPDKRSQGRNGEAPLAAAVLVPEHVDLLLAAGADPNAADRFGFTPLMQAARYGRSASVTRLLAAGAHLEARTQDLPAAPIEPAETQKARAGGKTALYFAALGGDSATVGLLLERGALSSNRDHFGTRPCEALALNTRLSDEEQAALQTRLCPARPSYAAPAPTTPTAPAAVASTLNRRITIDTERPVLQVGERWKQETRLRNGNTLKQVDDIVVTSVQPELIGLSINGQPGSMTAELAMRVGPRLRYDEGYQLLSFPLLPGKTWQFRTGWEQRRLGASGRLQMEVQVKGEETLKLAWGDTPAIKLEAQGTLQVEVPIRLLRKVSASYWYAPSVNAIVRTEWIDGAEDLVIEVVSHTPASQALR